LKRVKKIEEEWSTVDTESSSWINEDVTRCEFVLRQRDDVVVKRVASEAENVAKECKEELVGEVPNDLEFRPGRGKRGENTMVTETGEEDPRGCCMSTSGDNGQTNLDVTIMYEISVYGQAQGDLDGPQPFHLLRTLALENSSLWRRSTSQPCLVVTNYVSPSYPSHPSHAVVHQDSNSESYPQTQSPNPPCDPPRSSTDVATFPFPWL
jgi:hypothetical protein